MNPYAVPSKKIYESFTSFWGKYYVKEWAGKGRLEGVGSRKQCLVSSIRRTSGIPTAPLLAAAATSELRFRRGWGGPGGWRWVQGLSLVRQPQSGCRKSTWPLENQKPKNQKPGSWDTRKGRGPGGGRRTWRFAGRNCLPAGTLWTSKEWLSLGFGILENTCPPSIL